MTKSIRNWIGRHHRLLFYSAWLLLNIIQSAGTQLFDDEAYYWVYSEYPAWGYFDHPPMIALLIHVGYFLIPGELGVRLLPILMNTGSIFLTGQLIDKKDPLLFYAICTSLAVAQIAGIMAVPDIPLMFFVALFFVLYQRFIKDPSTLNTVFLGISMALMMYTKYHAVLVILLTVLSNVRLLRYKKIWIAFIIALLIFSPHLYWQHVNGYPSVQFHLFERNSFRYEFRHSLEFLAGQLLITGPLMGWLLLFAAFRYRPASPLERALKYTFAGVLIFFLISTLKGKSEANWTIPAFVGMIVLAHQFLVFRPRLARWLYLSVPFTLAIVISVRYLMMIDLPPTWWNFKDEFHGNRAIARMIRAEAGDLPVVILDSYQKPSKYHFYSGRIAMGLNTPDYRRNNYNFWKIEDSLLGKRVYAVGSQTDSMFTHAFEMPRLYPRGGATIPEYYSFSRVLVSDIRIQKNANQTKLHFTTRTPPHYLPYFQVAPYDTASLYLVLFDEKKLLKYLPLQRTVKDIHHPEQGNETDLPIPDFPPGVYQGKIAISSCIPGEPSLNSSSFAITIE